MPRRWPILSALLALLIGAIGAPVSTTAQDPLDQLAEGALRDQVRWFVELLNSGGEGVTADEVAAHFSPEFLEQVPAEEVLATVAQLRPVLGEVTVERVAGGSTETDAGVLLAGDSGVRVRVTLWVEPGSGRIAGLLIQPDTSAPPATPQATPQASPIASPVAMAAPAPAMDEVLLAYRAAEERVLGAGRSLMAMVLAGDDDGVLGASAPELALALGPEPVSSLLREVQTDRVHFEFDAVGAVFDGHFAGDTITGFFHQRGPGFFELTAEEPQTGSMPTGRWSGQIFGPGGGLDISVVFAGEADALTATLDIPDQGIVEQTLDDVSFQAQRPLGDLVSEAGLPLGGATGNDIYVAAYAWGPGTLAMIVGFDDEGRASSLRVNPTWPLPPDPMVDASPVRAHLPAAGTWLVVWGGSTELQNYHVATPAQRHAYDLVVWKDGATYSGDGTRNEQYHAWGQPVLAPVDGTVVTAWNNQADLLPHQVSDPELAQQIDPLTHPAGNHVVIRTGDDRFVLVAHMQEGSVRVEAGDEVRVGDVLGLVGNSGNSSEPHVHIHAQDRDDMLDPEAVGVPLEFTGYIADGEPAEAGSPVQGQLVAPAG